MRALKRIFVYALLMVIFPAMAFAQISGKLTEAGGGVKGCTPYHLVSAATTNATSVTAVPTTLYLAFSSNVNAGQRYLKLYDKASAPTVGTDVPKQTYIIPGLTTGSGHVVPIPVVGIDFLLGLAFALTVESTDAGSTGVAVNELVVNLCYK